MDKTSHPPSVCQIVWFIKLFSLLPINKTHLFVLPSLYPITTLSLLNEVLSARIHCYNHVIISWASAVRQESVRVRLCSLRTSFDMFIVCLFSFSQRYDFLKRATISSVIRKHKNCYRSVSLFII